MESLIKTPCGTRAIGRLVSTLSLNQRRIRSPGVAELVLAGRCRDVDLVPQDDKGPGCRVQGFACGSTGSGLESRV